MAINVISAKTAGEAWVRALQLVMTHGEDIKDKDAEFKANESSGLREVRNVYIEIDSVDYNDPIIRKYEYLLKEYQDTPIIKFLEGYYWTEGTNGYKIDRGYGQYIFNLNGVNQFDWLVQKLKDDPTSKSATIVFPLRNWRGKKPPCITVIDFKLRNNVLDVTAIFRSQCAWWKAPGNFIAISKHQQQIATAIGAKVGKLYVNAISSHIYEPDYENANKVINEVFK
ncbi:thymidylate synthase [Bacteroidia bacterium]|nr:thymidylate synthase [Bacteroidia bacterium]